MPASQTSAEDIGRGLSAADQASRLEAMALLRKQAVKGQDLGLFANPLLQIMRGGHEAEIALLLKLCKSRFEHLDEPMHYARHRVEAGLFGAIWLLGLKNPLAAVRKDSAYGLGKMLSYYNKVDPAEILGPEALATIAEHLADPGCDLGPEGELLSPRGTLTIAEKLSDLIDAHPKNSDFTPVFHALVPALEHLHYLISNQLVDGRHGSKLIEQVLEVARSLMVYKRVPLPPPRQPDCYPNYAAELLAFCNQHSFHTISDTDIYRLKGCLIGSKPYHGPLFEALESELCDLNLKESILYLLVRSLEAGNSLDYFLPRLQVLLADGRLLAGFLPEALSQAIEGFQAKTSQAQSQNLSQTDQELAGQT